jgi:hypothetical protein
MKNVLSLAALTSLATVVVACASAPTNDAALGSSSSPATVAATSQPTAPAAQLSGTWAFVLDASDVAKPIREQCASESGADAKKASTCWDAIAAEAAREKIRFTTDSTGHTVWRSFGDEGTKEVVFVEVPVELEPDGPGHVLAKVSGAPTGDHAAHFAKGSVKVMRIEVVDARTIAMNDPKKGRLVYTKE